MKKILLFLSGCFLLAVGAIGIFLPVLPTTPLVVLAAFCFSASSERAYKFITKSDFFAAYIHHYQSKEGVPLKTKVQSIAILWVLLIPGAVIMNEVWSYLMFLLIGIGVTTHLILLKTKGTDKETVKPEETSQAFQENSDFQ